MNRKQLPSPDSGVPFDTLERYANVWLLDSESACSPDTVSSRRLIVTKFLAFCRQRATACVDPNTIREFMVFLHNGHSRPGGRFGTPQSSRPMRETTRLMYFSRLRTFANFLVDEGVCGQSFLANVKPPRDHAQQPEPLSDAQTCALLDAARRTRHPRRDEAIVRLLHDTGIRCSELCRARVRELSLENSTLHIPQAKSGPRIVAFGSHTRRALVRYLAEEPHSDEDALFTADAGSDAGAPLQRNGLYQLIARLGRSAGINGVRCSPHTLRHTYAISALRAGIPLYTVQAQMGHSDNSLKLTRRYARIADCDVIDAHRKNSPGDRLSRSNHR